MTPRFLHRARAHILLRKEAVIAHDTDGNNSLLATFDTSLRALMSLARGRLVVVTIVVVIVTIVVTIISAATRCLGSRCRRGRHGPIGTDLKGCE